MNTPRGGSCVHEALKAGFLVSFQSKLWALGGGEVMSGDKTVPAAGRLQDFSQGSPWCLFLLNQVLLLFGPWGTTLENRWPWSPGIPVSPRWHSLSDHPGHCGFSVPSYCWCCDPSHSWAGAGHLTWTTYGPLGGSTNLSESLHNWKKNNKIVLLLLFAASLGLLLFLEINVFRGGFSV